MWTDNVFGPGVLAVESQSGAEAKFYRRLAENSLGLMCCHDLTGVLLWVNPAAACSLGYSSEQVVGSRIDEFLVSEIRFELAPYLERLHLTGSDAGLMRLRTKLGAERIWMYRNVLSDDPELPPHVLGHALDVTEHFSAKRALKEVFEQSPVGQFELEASGKLHRINAAACRLLGYSTEELFSPDCPAHVTNFFLSSFLATDTPLLLKFVPKDRSERYLEVFVRRVSSPYSPPGGLICAVIDCSDRVRAEIEIRNLNAQLETRVNVRTAELRRSNAELQEFACIVSHDLQAPLKQVGFVLDELGSKLADDDMTDLLRLCRRDIERMSALVESLLGYAVVSNRTDLVTRQVPLTVSVQESLMNLATVISACNAVVTYDSLPEVHVDESDFVQLFQNLIENAVKYRGPESPTVRISASEANGSWLISVSDNGLGIDPEHSERVFQAFRRLHGKEYAGTGMGLAICKKIVERAGGRIWVESRKGVGSTFRFTIPH